MTIDIPLRNPTKREKQSSEQQCSSLHVKWWKWPYTTALTFLREEETYLKGDPSGFPFTWNNFYRYISFSSFQQRINLLASLYKKVHTVFSSVLLFFLSSSRKSWKLNSFPINMLYIYYFHLFIIESIKIWFQLKKISVFLQLNTPAYGLSKSRYKNMIKH